MDRRVDCVICLWTHLPSGERVWELVESYPIDADGYSLVKGVPVHGDSSNRVTWQSWVSDGQSPIPGRAVTGCSLESGVQLVCLVPPEGDRLISSGFFLRRLGPDFYKVLRGGSELMVVTVEQARKWLGGPCG